MGTFKAREGKSGHRWARRFGIIGAITLAVSAGACGPNIPDTQVTPNYVGVVQSVLPSAANVAILVMTDGTTKTIDMNVQRSAYRLLYASAGDLLLLSTVPDSLGAAALSPFGGDPRYWSLPGGGKDAPDAYVVTAHGFRLKKAATFSSSEVNGVYPDNGSFAVDKKGELVSYG
jgi:hypothetical protein